MRNARVFIVAMAAALPLAVASAEDHPGAAIVYSVKPKPGSQARLDAALKQHYAWHRTQRDTSAWHVWQVISGPDIGDYVAGTFGHEWGEFDSRAAFDAADEADFFATVMPFVQAVDLGYWAYAADMSRPAAAPAPAAMSQVTRYLVKPEGFLAFTDALRAIRTALAPLDPPISFTWYRLISGGENPQFLLAVDRNAWAELAGGGKSLDQILVETVGAQRAVAIQAALRDSTRSTTSYMLRYRPDLSYVPAK